MKKLIGMLIISIVMNFWFVANNSTDHRKAVERLDQFNESDQGDRYDDGFNDALDCYVLLQLENETLGKLMTRGEMCDVCRFRCGVEASE